MFGLSDYPSSVAFGTSAKEEKPRAGGYVIRPVRSSAISWITQKVLHGFAQNSLGTFRANQEAWRKKDGRFQTSHVTSQNPAGRLVMGRTNCLC